ncbi:Hypothetical Protein FCC1311_032342 [Hondaea fermentalgiana]|uniref:Uncharacterized protein n=1 Tax=Hondaea fermentalgiana TaxID=2315210 RepID=A0A2R5GFI9_9STRA|nr:Hypothetical Protein FCC1311_032342 [Hondaea fermentalgiana]|eukprot:GBG27011.1 Hypothetical Protein FCC1311_032342 [Hondaea fermentalgiana]
MAEAIPPGLRASLPLALAALRREVATDGRPIVLHVCCLLGALGGRVNAVQHEFAPRSVADLFTLAASRAVSDLTLTSGRNVREEVATLRAEIHNVEGLLSSEDAAVLQELEQNVTAGMTPSCARVWAVLTASGALPWRESMLFKDIVAEQRSCVIATPHAQVARIESALDGVWDPMAAARAFFKVLPVCRGRAEYSSISVVKTIIIIIIIIQLS